MQNKKINAILFDLDGTLVDSLRDIADSMNSVLEKRGCPTHPVDAYRTLVGDGMEALAYRALPPDQRQQPEQVRECMRFMKQEYSLRWRRHSTPYEGVVELLRDCTDQGIRLGILSNKPEAFTREMVATLFPETSFATVRGAREGIPVKPDPASALEIQVQWGFPADSIAYVGDTDTDMKTGLAAGFRTVGVSWGFRDRRELEESGAHLVVDHPSELLLRIC